MDQYASVSKREMTISSVPEIFRFGERIEMWISLKVQKTQAVVIITLIFKKYCTGLKYLTPSVKYFNPV